MKHINLKSSFSALTLAAMLLATGASSCGNKNNDGSGDLPDNFNVMSDAAKVDFLMKHASPDSVARFICDAALGKIKGVKIDTIGLAVLQAYENYRDSDLVKFSETFDTYGKAQPLPDKMKLLMLSGQNDPQGLGYQLGLEYVGDLREKKMTVEQAVKEVEALRKACGDDTATFVRFLKGFQTVLRIDHGKDLSEELYQKFINYQ